MIKKRGDFAIGYFHGKIVAAGGLCEYTHVLDVKQILYS